jgi:ElaA protein
MHTILKARCDVFIVEQNCAFPEIDNIDLSAHHLMAWTANNELAAYLRIVPPGVTFPEPSLGRVLSAPSHRGTGIGRQLLIQGLKHLEARFPNLPVRIGAQSYLIEFYGAFGFKVDSDEYIEDGIPHVEMLRKV